MKKALLTMTVIAAVALSYAQQPPVLDRDLFFGNPEVSNSQLSPDGKYISFMKEYDGIMNIWVKSFDEPFDDARPLTNSARPLYGYFWTRDGKYILYVKDKDGDENINIFAVDPAAEATEEGVPESRNLTPMDEVTAGINMVSRKDPDLMFISLNDRDKAWHDLYKLKISTGELEMVYKNTDRITGFDFDWDENLRVINKTDEDGNTVMYRIDEEGGLIPIYDVNVNESAYIAGWNEDNSRCYLVTNKGELDKSALFLMDPMTKEMTLVESDPNNQVDFGGLRMDENTRKIIATSYVLDKQVYYWKDKKWENIYKFLQEKFPGREVGFKNATTDYSKMLFAVTGDRYASEVWFLEVDSRKLIYQYTGRPDLKEVEEYLAPMTPISYSSSDGLKIPAYLTLPVGTDGKNLPVIVLVHGGPKGPRDYWGYNSIVQFLANRGYAVLQPNFRASGGYGKNFMNAGDMQWGKLMQDDITWGVKYLIDQGIADKSRVAIMGGSYGGYATLAGLAFTPDLYACGVDIVGPSNLFTLLNSIPAYWEAARAFLYAMVGDPETPEGEKAIREASPLFSADKIVKPLLIVQGANDPRVNKAEADQIVIALREKGKKVEYLLAEDEGHGYAKPLNRMAMFAETEKFLAEILGGRYQESMSDEVSETLEKLRVDVSTVTYTPKEEVASASNLPEVKDVFTAGTAEYSVEFEVQGQKIPMEMTRTYEEKDGMWVVTEAMNSPMGAASDVATYTAEAIPVSRVMEQMGQKISLTFKENQAMAEVQGNTMEMKFDGAWISDGPGIDRIIAHWPLKEEYGLILEVPEVNTMKARQMSFKVTGKEELNGQSCWVVDMSSLDNPAEKTTLWIGTESKAAEKAVSIMPSMGNATMTITRK